MPTSEEKLLLPASERKLLGSPDERGRRKRSRWLLALLIAAVLVVTGVLFFMGWVRQRGVTREVDAAAERERDAAPMVNVAKVSRAPGDVAIMLPGNITPLTEAFIYARASGYVKKRYADFGDRVTDGQLLAEIDSPDLDNQVAQARATLTQAESQASQIGAQLENQQSQLNLARVTWDRYRVLAARGAIARQDADQQETTFHTAEAGVRAAQANVAAAQDNVKATRANLDRLIALQEFEKVRAPFSGVITARNFDIGALISAAGSSQGASSGGSGGTGTGELFHIARFDVLRILVDVPQENAPWIKPGQNAEVSVQEFPNRKFTGRVTRTTNSVNVSSRTMMTEVQIQNSDFTLLPGMYAQVVLHRNKSEPSLLVPGDSIITANQGLQIAILLDVPKQAQNDPKYHPGVKRIHLTPVQVGRDNGQQIEITSGLHGWEYVVVNPGDTVEEGTLVQPVTTPARPSNRSNGKGSSPRK